MSIYKENDLVKLGKGLYRELLIINGSENFKKGFGKLIEKFEIFLTVMKKGRKRMKFRNSNNFVRSMVNLADKIPEDLSIDIKGKQVYVFDQYIELLKKVLANTDMHSSELLEFVKGNKEYAIQYWDQKSVTAIQIVENLIAEETEVQLSSKKSKSGTRNLETDISKTEIHLDDDMEMLEVDLKHQLEVIETGMEKIVDKLETARETAELDLEAKVLEHERKIKERSPEAGSRKDDRYKTAVTDQPPLDLKNIRSYFRRKMQSLEFAFQEKEKIITSIEDSEKDLTRRLSTHEKRKTNTKPLDQSLGNKTPPVDNSTPRSGA